LGSAVRYRRGTVQRADNAVSPYIAVLMTILIQATTTKWLAGKLNLLGNSSPRDTH
jgi:hypothetical protein